ITRHHPGLIMILIEILQIGGAGWTKLTLISSYGGCIELITSKNLDKVVLGSVLLVQAVFKIAEFGFARSLQPRGLTETLCGSPLHMAPEIILGRHPEASSQDDCLPFILYDDTSGPGASIPSFIDRLNEICFIYRPVFPLSVHRSFCFWTLRKCSRGFGGEKNIRYAGQRKRLSRIHVVMRCTHPTVQSAAQTSLQQVESVKSDILSLIF
ncbi:hypothetical protein MKW98_021489, partial [Papaver atlanticum]